jgi:ArsR family transcriptional regulator
MGTDSSEQLSQRFRALGDPVRLRLMALLAASKDCELCLCDLTEPVGLAQPTVTHHMKQLTRCGLVTRDQRGKWAYFRIVEENLPSVSLAELRDLACP